MSEFDKDQQQQQEGNSEEAIATYRRALELNSNDSWAHHQIGEALAKLGRYDEAVTAYRHAIELKPDFSWSYHHLGEALAQQQEWEQSAVGFRKAIELNPEHFGSYVGLGNSLAKLGQLDEAIAAYTRASELNPEADWIAYALANTVQQRNQSHLAEAIASYRHTIALNPDNVEAYHNLLQVQPDNWEVWLQLGDLLRKLNHWDEASATYRRALELNPEAYECHFKSRKGELVSMNSIDMNKSLLNFSELEKIGYQIEVFSSEHNISNWRELNGSENISYIFEIDEFLRLGNSLFQLLNGIYLAESYKGKLVHPGHYYLKLNQGEINFSTSKPTSWLVKIKGNFFIVPELIIPNSESLKILHNTIFNLVPYREDKSIGERTLVIHIRSGDVFSNFNVHPLYIQPPLSYYQKIIEHGNYQDIVVVTEPDRLNPCIDELLIRYNARVQSNSLEEDVNTILSAKHLVIGQGTFGNNLSMISPNLQKLYCPFFLHYSHDHLFHIAEELPYQTIFARLPFYIFPSVRTNEYEFEGWKNSYEQKKFMLFYPKEMIELISPPYFMNIALKKPATQSSVYGGARENDAPGGVNGVKNGKFGFHTDIEEQPWWQVDLQDYFHIKDVKIYNRLDDCYDRANTLTVLISVDAVDWEQVYIYNESKPFGGINGSPLIVEINRIARYVKLQLLERNYLHLDEVEVYGYQVDSDSVPETMKMPKEPIYLHLGCGNLDHPEFINIDIRPAPHIDYVRAIDDLSIFADESVDLIYASHCLEHFSHVQIPRILKEWHRVLKVNGILRLAVPNLDLIIKMYHEHGNCIGPILGRLMGGQDYEFNYHKTIFNQASLEHLLLEVANFKEVRMWQPGTTDITNFPDSSRDPVSLNMEAIK
ncbi:tetratricopeptide repeat protein [Microcoleus sp. D3_18_C4]|uniref:tetratricopeptide repeat protein n=1 Tax=Microcoleus sp. D3_18_C4 TaxID=3055335 RepID=UPI002FD33380